MESSSDACLSSNNTTESSEVVAVGGHPQESESKPTLPPIEYYSERQEYMEPMGECKGVEGNVAEDDIVENEDGEGEEDGDEVGDRIDQCADEGKVGQEADSKGSNADSINGSDQKGSRKEASELTELLIAPEVNFHEC